MIRHNPHNTISINLFSSYRKDPTEICFERFGNTNRIIIVPDLFAKYSIWGPFHWRRFPATGSILIFLAYKSGAAVSCGEALSPFYYLPMPNLVAWALRIETVPGGVEADKVWGLI